MKKITIITGDQGTGKSTKAREIAGLIGTLFICSSEGFEKLIDDSIHCLVFDMPFYSLKDLSNLKNLCRSEKMQVRRAYTKVHVEVKIPDIIIIIQGSLTDIQKQTFDRCENVEFIHLTEQMK